MKIQNVLNMPVSVASTKILLDFVQENAATRGSAFIAVSNVHMCMESFDDLAFNNVLSKAHFVIPDGRPIYWALKLLGNKFAQQIRGQDIFESLCQMASERGLNIGLYGGFNQQVLDSAISQILERYPSVNITYSYSPPFRDITDQEMGQIFSEISNTNVDILFVGIGCPKQEKWMCQALNKINCTMIGVGAVFDFVSGEKKHAPRWMQKAGLEWLFRLLSEPKRLWKRYLKQNPRFIYYFLQQWLLKKDFTKEGP